MSRLKLQSHNFGFFYPEEKKTVEIEIGIRIDGRWKMDRWIGIGKKLKETSNSLLLIQYFPILSSQKHFNVLFTLVLFWVKNFLTNLCHYRSAISSKKHDNNHHLCQFSHNTNTNIHTQTRVPRTEVFIQNVLSNRIK